MTIFRSIRSIRSINPRAGFTLVEVLVASAIFVAVMVMVVASFASVTGVQNKVLGQRSLNQSARFALESIGQLTRRADLTGVVHGTSIYGAVGFNIDAAGAVSLADIKEPANGIVVFSSVLPGQGSAIFRRLPDGQLVRKDLTARTVTDANLIDPVKYNPLGGSKMTVEAEKPFTVDSFQQAEIPVDRYPDSRLTAVNENLRNVVIPFPLTKVKAINGSCKQVGGGDVTSGILALSKNVYPTTVDCSLANIVLEVTNTGQPGQERQNLDLVLVLDYSGSMGCSPGDDPATCEREQKKIEALRAGVTEILAPGGPLDPAKDRVGAVLYRTEVARDEVVNLTNNFSRVQNLITGRDPVDLTNIQEGIWWAGEVIADGRQDALRVIVLISDGAANVYMKNDNNPGAGRVNCHVEYPRYWDDPRFVECIAQAREAAVRAADPIKFSGASIYTRGVGIGRNAPIYTDAVAALKGIASQPNFPYFAMIRPEELPETLRNIINIVLPPFISQDMQIIESLPPGISYIDNSANVPPTFSGDNRQILIWPIGILDSGQTVNRTFRVRIGSTGPRLVTFESNITNQPLEGGRPERSASSIYIKTGFSTRSNFQP